jgi:hypothetical protein
VDGSAKASSETSESPLKNVKSDFSARIGPRVLLPAPEGGPPMMKKDNTVVRQGSKPGDRY